jgi:CubicO group peptidase (beta-lactamase class C family)
MASDYNSLRRLALAAIHDRVIPGLVMAVGQAGQVDFVEAFGQRQLDPEPAPATIDTIYDLASLTKAVVTSLLVMKGVEEGRLHLDRPLGDHLGMLADRPEITLRRVLAHAGGFPAHRKFYERTTAKVEPSQANRAAIGAWAAAEPPAYQPGSKSIYSDLGFILLGALIEQVMCMRLDVLAERSIFQALGLFNLGFVDLLAGARTVRFRGHDVAPTERCPVRGRLVVGEVHDLNAFAMGGIAGHAGLFGGVRDLLQLAFALCAAFHGRGVDGGAPLVRPEVLRAFWQPAGIPGSTWRLGWDGPSAQGSLAGELISRRAVGHLSFTGCSLWIDPEQETCVVVLTNRIHPEVRDDPRFRALRPALHDAALQAIGYRAR